MHWDEATPVEAARVGRVQSGTERAGSAGGGVVEQSRWHWEQIRVSQGLLGPNGVSGSCQGVGMRQSKAGCQVQGGEAKQAATVWEVQGAHRNGTGPEGAGECIRVKQHGWKLPESGEWVKQHSETARECKGAE